jgi:hypothetical protein
VVGGQRSQGFDTSCANRKLTIPSRIWRRNHPKVSNLGPHE